MKNDYKIILATAVTLSVLSYFWPPLLLLAFILVAGGMRSLK